MDELTLLSTVTSHFDDLLSIEVATSGVDDDRPVPALILDDWTTEDLNPHNSAFAGEGTDDTGSYERYLRFDWETRLDFIVVDPDEVAAIQHRDTVVDRFRVLSEYPSLLHEDIKTVSMRNSDDPNHTFVEPAETELSVTAVIEGDHVITVGPSDLGADPIEVIQTTFKADNDTAIPLSD